MKMSDKKRLQEYAAKERREQDAAAVKEVLRTIVDNARRSPRSNQLALMNDLLRIAEKHPQLKTRCDRARLKIKAMK